MKHMMKKLGVLLVCLCLTLSMAMPAFATSTDVSSDDNRNGVLQINTYYQPKDKTQSRIPVFNGTAFLVNEQMVVTAWHVLHFDLTDEDTLAYAQQLEETYGEPFASDPDALTGTWEYEIVVRRDNTTTATILQDSSKADFSILQLKDTINRKVLTIGDPSSVQVNDSVTSLGFPGLPLEYQDDTVFVASDVVATAGVISQLTSIDNIPRFMHSATISDGSSGGPLLNAAGEVIGINVLGDGTYFYATSIEEVTALMDDYGYEYTTGDGSAAVETEATEETAAEETTEAATEAPTEAALDTSALEAAIASANTTDTSNLTDDSAQAIEEALAAANTALSATSQSEIDSAAEALNNAVKNAEEKSSNMTMIIIIIAVIVVLLIVVVVVVVSSRNKKSRNQTVVPPTPPVHPVSSANGGQGFNRVPPVQTPDVGPSYGETSVLDAGAGETTVLNSSQASGGYLVRQKTGEKISLTKQVFTVGKERSRVDYCISDNTSISRVHARFVQKADGCYVADQRSTNFTYVNGVKLSPNQEVRLGDMDTVKLSDETFEFHKG